ncbi:MAG: anthranilate synthase component I family protein [Cyclobacteriaceae bacterium]|nr:anthranilate synthase component I family protein [Cyclobacteriaceae bacterium]UYN85668.1 MAG: anthranilate synthase component I family protein [Cyclobacteriaceae bacterium]
MKHQLKIYSKKLLADTLTPVNIYLKLRDVFAGSILLESSDYHGHENSLSLICCDPVSGFVVEGDRIKVQFPNGKLHVDKITNPYQVIIALEDFRSSFHIDQSDGMTVPGMGLFGYMAYDAVRFFENVEISRKEALVPDIIYNLYRYVIVVDHFSNELTLVEHTLRDTDQASTLDRVEKLIFSNRFSTYRFKLVNGETSNLDDEAFMDSVKKGIEHCNRGDVFQLVLSRRFTSTFKGDEFNVYRSLRSINPSPYLFYFDYGNFKLFGSSPEAQLKVSKHEASIFPIAGTFRRTGDDQKDAELASELAKDEKENAEHIMLVDLARNDMSRHAHDVKVAVFKEIQYYSHVIHLVSEVKGKLDNQSETVKMAAATFPAGTLSGAPKHKAITLIDKYENVNRGFYGGAIGFLGFNGDFNHAIMIRTFLSKDNQLTYQAGAGIVSKSDPKSELQEVNNKLAALRKAVVMAETL